MNAQSECIVLLAVFAVMFIAVRCVVGQMMAMVPQFASPIEEAEPWPHAFGV